MELCAAQASIAAGRTPLVHAWRQGAMLRWHPALPDPLCPAACGNECCPSALYCCPGRYLLDAPLWNVLSQLPDWPSFESYIVQLQVNSQRTMPACCSWPIGCDVMLRCVVCWHGLQGSPQCSRPYS